MPRPSKTAIAAGAYQRIAAAAETKLTGTTTGSILHGLIISSDDSGATTCTLEDGTGNTIHQFEVPTKSSRYFNMHDIIAATDWRVTPSDTNIDVLAMFTV